MLIILQPLLATDYDVTINYQTADVENNSYLEINSNGDPFDNFVSLLKKKNILDHLDSCKPLICLIYIKIFEPDAKDLS